jgi:hypothetical protein
MGHAMTDGDRTRRPGRLVTLLGVLLIVGAPTVWVAAGSPGGPASQFDARATLTAVPAEGSDPAAPVDAGVAEAPDASTSEDTYAAPSAEIPVASEPSPFTTTAPRGAIDPTLWPAGVVIPALAVTAPVQAVGVEPGGVLIIPPSPMDVGWYQGGSVPGEPGVALLSSHIDTRTEGRGVFSGLVRLAEGDEILVTAADGTVQRWTVIARTQHRKDDLPVELFARSGDPVLALVTCGGPFDSTVRSYRDNVIVWARPAA